ncbi:unnamed protein product [Nippostrongylus brasiliensis]|uniref:Uncharacterized protein n=1 Tax=Nippostrongylus brasiliensis TaxID=27835 RepID=A0A0N4XZV9_NIPBR|nr:unnamed protein product [Nippostrongylus brasiliensis]
MIIVISSDIEDRYTKKLDRLRTTGRGPLMPFVEKKEYKPRSRNPGKKQTEKRFFVNRQEGVAEADEQLRYASWNPVGTVEEAEAVANTLPRTQWI